MEKGFTLIELVIAFALLISASVVGIAGYRSYSDSQKIQNATLDVALMLQKAKSRAQSQVKPSTLAACQTNPLNGYEVRICGVSGSLCLGSGRYELHIVCGNNSGLIEAKQLPSSIVFANTTQPTYIFRVINGTASAGVIIIDNGSGVQKTIQVTGLGNITVQ